MQKGGVDYADVVPKNRLSDGLLDGFPGGFRALQEVPKVHPREISISKCMNGFMVRVGCKILVFETHGKLLKELERYLNNTAKVEKEYLSLEK